MKMEPECISCSFRQSERVLNFLRIDRDKKFDIIQKISKYYYKLKSFDDTPAYYGSFVYQMISELTGVKDPYSELKDKYNKLILSYENEILNRIEQSNNKLYTALKYSAIGNQIDFGVDVEINIEKEISIIDNISFAIDDCEFFFKKLKTADKLILLADNAGEVIFDIIFLEEIHKFNKNLNLIIAVKSAPIINDITLQDMKKIDYPKFIKIIGNGNGFVGTILKKCSEEFKKEFFDADIIISKGQANFETLNKFTKKDIFFLFKSKCAIVSNYLGVKTNDYIFQFNNK